MTDRRLKLLEKLQDHPKAVTPAELERVLQAFGYERARQKGSHRTYTKAGEYPIVVPYKRPHVGRIYVEQVIVRLTTELFLDEMGGG